MDFPDDWYEDIDGRSQMLSFEKVGAEIERLRAALKPFAELGYDGVPNQTWIDNAKAVLEQPMTEKP